MDAFAIYRLPLAHECTLVSQRGVPDSLSSLGSLEDACAFVIAPFCPTPSVPVVVLRPDKLLHCSVDQVAAMDGFPFYLAGSTHSSQASSRETYHDDFCRFQQLLSTSQVQKLVLARCADVSRDAATSLITLFVKACNRYPEAFVTLFSAPQCGTWLVATPEVLLSRSSERWNTMALAGTMRHGDQLPPWSDKNKREQAYVSQYISDCLERYSDDVKMSGPYTTRAGILAHLRTDFSFTLPAGVAVGELLAALHPTPAVCGLPKHEAYRFILDKETVERSYYSGFSGPLNLGGDTAMFVSLRCMRVLEDRYRLYAGGGILPESLESMEWDETQAKMQAMLSLID